MNSGDLRDAVHSHTLRRWLSEHPDHPQATALGAVCDRIEAQTVAEADRLSGRLVGVDVVPDTGGQLHRIEIEASDRSAARRVVETLMGEGYEPWHRWTGGALESFYRSADRASLVRLDEPAVTIELRWPGGALPGALRPTAADWRTVVLPRWAWPAYHLVRPVRLLLDRFGLLPARPPVLGPILSTPSSLVEPLLDFAEVGPDDHVIDLGCGDGRLAIAAARQRGCRATGVELDPTLAAMARDHVAAAGLGERVDIVEGDAATADLRNATVILAFLPAQVIGDVVGSARGRGFTGPIVSHEQHRVLVDPPPERSEVLVGDDAVTVAHRW